MQPLQKKIKNNRWCSATTQNINQILLCHKIDEIEISIFMETVNRGDRRNKIVPMIQITTKRQFYGDQK